MSLCLSLWPFRVCRRCCVVLCSVTPVVHGNVLFGSFVEGVLGIWGEFSKWDIWGILYLVGADEMAELLMLLMQT